MILNMLISQPASFITSQRRETLEFSRSAIGVHYLQRTERLAVLVVGMATFVYFRRTGHRRGEMDCYR